ncbi:YIP1 family protein [Halobaculum sp. CBA1158]|uniref:YIP1 family protein n=1 Tax=Halobaculum sp. CBA1158 TaxID=2904243 RepID=UPI001F173737|nr:YIP1 family protein [Halobaculum sp. CBA1158]UIO98669.1 YIP1 family protein [Halobaculum sp. CBA1158]
MTTWVDNPEGGRARGPTAVARAWAEVLTRPTRFFRSGVAPGDQAPGLVFAVCVAVAFASVRFLFDPTTIPGAFGGSAVSALVSLLFVAVFLAPAALHLTAAFQTVLLMAFVRERAGVSETVQVLAYASAPCALAGPPIPELRAACALYGAGLLALGVREVHDTTTGRAVAATTLPAALVFGVGFRGFDAAVQLLVRWYII